MNIDPHGEFPIPPLLPVYALAGLYGFAFGDQARFRVSVFRQKGNVTLVLRLIPTDILAE